MGWIVLMVILLVACWGGYLLWDYFTWRFGGVVVTAEVKGFQEQKNKGRALPLVEYELPDGKMQKAAAERIDQFLYMISPPGVGQFTPVVYQKGDPVRVRVYGIVNLVAGLFLVAPLLFIFAGIAGSSLAFLQITYVLIFGLIAVGGWSVLKLIQRYY